MSGLLFFAVVGVWLCPVYFLMDYMVRKIPKKWWKPPLIGVLSFVVFVLPITDEIVGGLQFRQLCKKHEIIQVDRETAVGKTVYYEPQPSIDIEGAWVHIALQPWAYVDSITGEPIISYNTLLAGSGLLYKTFSSGGAPLMFRGSCGPKESPRDIFKSLQIIALDR